MEAELSKSGQSPTDVLDLCRSMAERSPVPTAAVNLDTKVITCVNLAFCLLTGRARETLIGRPVCQVVPDAQQCLAVLDQVHESGEAASQEATSNGPVSSRWTYTIWPVTGRRTRPSAVILQVTEASTAGQDAVLINQALLLGALRQHELMEAAELLNIQLRAEIMARTTAEKALLKSEKLTVAGRMAAVLAHEINNPLTAVMNLLYVIRTAEGVPPEVLEHLDVADGELRRIAHIARQTLGFYRDTGVTIRFQVRPLLDSTVDLLRARVRATAACIAIRCDPALTLTGSVGELRQVLSNLLLNSLDAIGPGGRVVIRASSSVDPRNGTRGVKFTVADDGVGIAQSSFQDLFEAFYTTKGSVGNGLGLWVCKQIIDAHHGRVRIRSKTTDPRRGTTLSFWIPQSL